MIAVEVASTKKPPCRLEQQNRHLVDLLSHLLPLSCESDKVMIDTTELVIFEALNCKYGARTCVNVTQISVILIIIFHF